MESVDLSKVCRLCLKGGSILCPIFGVYHQMNVHSGTNGGAPTTNPSVFPPLHVRIMSFAQVKLIEGDGLPENICSSCLTQVDRSYQFKLLCESSDFALRGVAKAAVAAAAAAASNLQPSISDEDDSLDGNELWDMTKFTPEVIIKEENDLGEEDNLNGRFVTTDNDDEDEKQPGLHHSTSTPPPPGLYPIPGLMGVLGSDTSVTGVQILEPHAEHNGRTGPSSLVISSRTQGNDGSQSKSRRCRGGDKLFKCRQCNKSYSFSSALSRHKAVHNTALRPHVCTICNKGFTQSDKLIRHQKTHSIEFFMSCESCQRQFKSYGAYQKHMASGGCQPSIPPPPPPLPPPPPAQPIQTPPVSQPSVGQQPSTQDPAFDSQQQDSPSGGRNSGKGKPEFTCKVCSKLFATRGSLEVHSTIHTGVRPFVCSVCDKSFRHKVNLMEHFQRKHSLVRPYICDVCAARFVTKQELVRHYRKHIGD